MWRHFQLVFWRSCFRIHFSNLDINISQLKQQHLNYRNKISRSRDLVSSLKLRRSFSSFCHRWYSAISSNASPADAGGMGGDADAAAAAMIVASLDFTTFPAAGFNKKYLSKSCHSIFKKNRHVVACQSQGHGHPNPSCF